MAKDWLPGRELDDEEYGNPQKFINEIPERDLSEKLQLLVSYHDDSGKYADMRGRRAIVGIIYPDVPEPSAAPAAAAAAAPAAMPARNQSSNKRAKRASKRA